MAKQTLIIETAKELSLNDGMIVITDRDTGDVELKVNRRYSYDCHEKNTQPVFIT